MKLSMLHQIFLLFYRHRIYKHIARKIFPDPLLFYRESRDLGIFFIEFLWLLLA